MTDKNASEERLVRFGNNHISLAEVEKKRETVQEAQTHLGRLNERYPELASDCTRQAAAGAVVDRAHKGAASSAEESAAAPVQIPGLEELLDEMVGDMSVDEVLETLSRSHGIDIDSATLARAVGAEAYAMMLRRELEQYEQNFLSEEQISELWNEAGISVPGGGVWTAVAIGQLKQS
jgi:hypothetical protein